MHVAKVKFFGAWCFIAAKPQGKTIAGDDMVPTGRVTQWIAIQWNFELRVTFGQLTQGGTTGVGLFADEPGEQMDCLGCDIGAVRQAGETLHAWLVSARSEGAVPRGELLIGRCGQCRDFVDDGIKLSCPQQQTESIGFIEMVSEIIDQPRSVGFVDDESVIMAAEPGLCIKLQIMGEACGDLPQPGDDDLIG